MRVPSCSCRRFPGPSRCWDSPTGVLAPLLLPVSRGPSQKPRIRPMAQWYRSEHRLEHSAGTLHPAQNRLSCRCRSRASPLQENGPACVCTSSTMRRRPRKDGHGVPKVADRCNAKSSELLSPFRGVERKLGWGRWRSDAATSTSPQGLPRPASTSSPREWELLATIKRCDLPVLNDMRLKIAENPEPQFEQ